MRDKLTNFYLRHEHTLWLSMLAAGFVFDVLTSTRVDVLIDNLFLLSYLLIAGASIATLYASTVHGEEARVAVRLAVASPLALRFAFGGLFSRFILFYSHSGSIFTSWPFLITLIILFLGNEFFNRRYLRLVFELGIFFTALFSYATFAVPIVVRELGPHVFIASGFLSLAVIWLFVRFLAFISPKLITMHQTLIGGVLIGIYLVFNVLYFSNIIPPIPLALEEGGIYHYVARSGSSTFNIKAEVPPWYLSFLPYDRTLHWRLGQPIYAYTAVFAPKGISATIIHRWEYFDTKKNSWIVSTEIPLGITGGRDGGYRGYSMKEGLFAGKWRVDVVTERDQLLGRLPFTLIEAVSDPEIKLLTR